MKSLPATVLLALVVFVIPVSSQTQQAYGSSGGDTEPAGLLDPSRFSIHHSVGFGMSTTGESGLKSQSLYATMMQYKFNKPVTLNLNFGLPIHNSLNSDQNLTQENIESLSYFENMPFDVSLTWQPRDNFLMRFSVSKRSYGDMLYERDDPFGYSRRLYDRSTDLFNEW
jgi:hypothetical protein